VGIIHLSCEAQEKFIALLLNPRKPNRALKKAFALRQARVVK